MPTAIEDVRRHRARYAALTRDRAADDPELLAAKQSFFSSQRHAGASAILDSVQASVEGQPFETVVGHLNVRDVPIGMRLYEAVALLSHIVGLSDRPGELLDALRDLAAPTAEALRRPSADSTETVGSTEEPRER